MAKKIFATETEIAEFLRSAQAQLLVESRNLKKRKFQNDQADGVTLNFKLKEVKDDRKATITFSAQAYMKIFALVHTYSTEVEWHGVVERTAADAFYIKDILIFPHKVTGAMVISDQTEYEKWLDTLDNDTFNALRFHGHSHVNMGVTPSGVDMTYRHNILNNFGTPSATSDLFYIFLIFNKKGDISGEIYDLQNNALYSKSTNTDEINIVVEDCDWLTDFLDEAKRVVTESYSYNNTGFGSGGYNGGNYGGSYGATTTPKTNSPKRGAKAEARQGSLLDDNDPDPMDDEYYAGVYGSGRYGGHY
jgi:hypothetical protein